MSYGMAWAAAGIALAAHIQHQHQQAPPTSPPQHQHSPTGSQHTGHSADTMKGRLGEWSMASEGSGTSRLPSASPMFMKHLGKWQNFDANLMGIATLNASDAGGRRGPSQVFSNSMVMAMGRKPSGKGILGFSVMGSLDALFNGKKGYPNLFQTGETAFGEPLKDRQHPHDLFSELALTYSHPIGGGNRAFFYGGPVAEPALGGPMYLHRPSGMEIPEAPISHHWFDSTHISFGVLTAGFTLGEQWQIEASGFNGHEPDEDRFDFDSIELNSASGRITYNPNANNSIQVSYGYLDSPEALEPGVDQHRVTASWVHSRPIGPDSHWDLAAFFGQNVKSEGETTSALGIEATYFRKEWAIFGRFELAEKDELVDVPPGTHKINKLVFGATKTIAERNGFDVGLGGFIGLHAFPSALEPAYGKNPVTIGVFLRVRPSRMPMPSH